MRSPSSRPPAHYVLLLIGFSLPNRVHGDVSFIRGGAMVFHLQITLHVSNIYYKTKTGKVLTCCILAWDEFEDAISIGCNSQIHDTRIS